MAAPVLTAVRPGAAVARVLARLVDPQTIGDRRWKGSCPVHGVSCTLDIRQARDGRAQLSCGASAKIGDLLDALGLTLDDIGPPTKLAPGTLERIDHEVARATRELVAAALDAPDEIVPGLAARGFRDDVIPDPLERALLAAIRQLWDTVGTVDLPMLADAVARTGVATRQEAWDAITTHIGLAIGVNAIGARCQLLEDVATRRRLWATLGAMRNLALDSDLTPLEFITEARQLVDDAALQLQATQQADAPTLRELLADPENLADPVAVVPRLAWRGHATLLSGPEKAGKSSYLGAAAAAVSNGDAFLDEPIPAGDVLWFALDEPKKHAIRRLVRHGANEDRVRVIERLPQGHADLVRLLTRYRPALTIIDTLGTYVSPQVESMNDRSQMLRALTPLMHLVRDTDTALVLVHHDKKTGGYSDSQAIGGAVDVILQWTDPETAGDRGRRDVKAKGRVDVYDHSVRLDGTQYVPVDRREMTMDALLLEYIQHHPLCSTNEVESKVPGNAQRKRDELWKLAERGAITDENRYATKSMAWRLVRPGETPPPLPGARVYGRGGAR